MRKNRYHRVIRMGNKHDNVAIASVFFDRLGA